MDHCRITTSLARFLAAKIMAPGKSAAFGEETPAWSLVQLEGVVDLACCQATGRIGPVHRARVLVVRGLTGEKQLAVLDGHEFSRLAK